LGREADHSSPSSAEWSGVEWSGAILPLPNTPSLRDAELKKSTGIILPLPFTKILNRKVPKSAWTTRK